VSFWTDKATTHRQQQLQHSLEEQARQLADQRRLLAALVEQVARLERPAAETDPREATAGSSASDDTTGDSDSQLLSMASVAASLKVLRRQSKSFARDFDKLQTRLSRLVSPLDPAMDERFLEAVRPLIESRRTMLGYDRLSTLWQAARNTAELDCPAVEIGTFQGGSAALLAQAFHTFAATPRQLHVVDTFEGHLDSTLSHHDPAGQRGKFHAVTVETVREFLSQFPGITVHQGDATLVIASWPDREYSVVHLDVDLYRPTLHALEYFGTRLAGRGIIVVDDYQAPTCPGVALAVDEYLASGSGFQTWRLRAEQIVLIKR
jgi:hypothetical protein